jgi:hypothetical protein
LPIRSMVFHRTSGSVSEHPKLYTPDHIK